MMATRLGAVAETGAGAGAPAKAEAIGGRGGTGAWD
jgi:hypothetical protein